MVPKWALATTISVVASTMMRTMAVVATTVIASKVVEMSPPDQSRGCRGVSRSVQERIHRTRGEQHAPAGVGHLALAVGALNQVQPVATTMRGNDLRAGLVVHDPSIVFLSSLALPRGDAVLPDDPSATPRYVLDQTSVTLLLPVSPGQGGYQTRPDHRSSPARRPGVQWQVFAARQVNDTNLHDHCLTLGHANEGVEEPTRLPLGWIGTSSTNGQGVRP
jgi:hypothetical protein